MPVKSHNAYFFQKNFTKRETIQYFCMTNEIFLTYVLKTNQTNNLDTLL